MYAKVLKDSAASSKAWLSRGRTSSTVGNQAKAISHAMDSVHLAKPMIDGHGSANQIKPMVPSKYSTISKDTPIVTRMVAEDAVSYVKNITSPQFEKQVGKLVSQANTAYRTDPAFAKNVNRSGNAGRDFLRTWMRSQLPKSSAKKTDTAHINSMAATLGIV